MTTPFLNPIDWNRPWLNHLLPVAQRVVKSTCWRSGVNDVAAASGLRNHRGLPIHFVPQADLPSGQPYETWISQTGRVPTRDNLHDFFNALVWLTFPSVKTQLNALQAEEIAKSSAFAKGLHPTYSSRGRLRDAATIFDENAALLVVSDTKVLSALREHRWSDALIGHRGSYGHTWKVWLFGHALMEKLVTPYKAITGHAWPLVLGHTFFERCLKDQHSEIDKLVSRQLSDGLATSQFTPLPVLGLPGWWHEQDKAFYEDLSVFRPKRTKTF